MVDSSRYRRVVITAHGGPEVLEVVEEPMPHPGPADVRIRTMAAGVSAHDLMLRRAGFPGFPTPPFTPGVDVVGVVDEVGDDADGGLVGRTVAALLPDDGGYAEIVTVPADHVVPVPTGIDPTEAVCAVANYVTAHTMLHRGAEVRRGERALVQGAAGGVGSALLDLGRHLGLETFGTASGTNLEFVRSFGATAIDRRVENVAARIRYLTGDGVDVVFDPIGGFGQLVRSYRMLRRGGRLVWFGVAATSHSGRRVIPASLAARTLLALVPDGRRAPMPPNAMKPLSWYRDSLATVLGLLAAGEIHPAIAATFPLTEAAQAHELLEHGGHRGKVVLVAPDATNGRPTTS